MIKHSKILLAGIAVTLCLSALLIFPVAASGITMSAGSVPAADCIADSGQHRENFRAIPEAQGIDVTEIPASPEYGDMVVIHALVPDLHDENITDGDEGSFFQMVDDIIDDICAGEYGPGGDRIGELKREDQVDGHISMFEEQGIDVTALRTAFELGDMDTVRVLMAILHDECMSEVAVADSGNVSISCGEKSTE